MLPKKERFCELYVQLNNATEAAKQAGYSQKTAYSQGCRLLKDAECANYIATLRAKLSEETGITTEFVINNLKEVAERCLQKRPVMVFNHVEKRMEQKVDEDTGEGVWEFDSSGANKALELLGKHLGVFDRDNKQKNHDIIVDVE